MWIAGMYLSFLNQTQVHKALYDMLLSEKRYVVYAGGMLSGKTYFNQLFNAMNNTTTSTKIWTTWTGSKIPVPLMSDDHVKAAYKRVCEIILAHECHEKAKERQAIGDAHGVETALKWAQHIAKSPLTREQAVTFKECFEEDAKRRKIKLPSVTLGNYHESFDERNSKRYYSKRKFNRLMGEEDNHYYPKG